MPRINDQMEKSTDDDADECLISALAHPEGLLLDSVDLGYGGGGDGGEEV